MTSDPAATFKDLCIDVVDVDRAVAFWAPVLGLRAESRPAGAVLMDGVTAHTVWLNAVPEPKSKSAKSRVHLDVHTASVDAVVALGAVVQDDRERWTVLRDPEGMELCAFVRPPERLPDYRVYELVVDAADPTAIASWWAERFGTTVQADADSGWLPAGSGLPWEMVFVAVPEPKSVKNRMHWDVTGSTAELLAAGATLLRARDAEISWDVLADPEGNEFCVFAPG